MVRSRGVALTRRGKQLVGLCPFHDDHEPSLVVDPVKQLWNCLGACKEGGDVYKFVMKADGISFVAAHRRLSDECKAMSDESERKTAQDSEKAQTRGHRDAANENSSLFTHRSSLCTQDCLWLERAVEHYHKRLLETPLAQEYLLSRGIAGSEIVTSFKLGYADGSLLVKLSTEGKASLRRVGVLTGSGRELMRGCVVFPLAAAASNRTVSLYGRRCEMGSAKFEVGSSKCEVRNERSGCGVRHLYLPGERRGVFNAAGARNTDEVIITESVIDGAALTTTLAYDELNRLTSKTYSDTTPAVSYFYDANQPASVPVGYSRGSSIGRLTAVTTSTTGNYYGYDSLGRTNQSYQRLDGTDYAFSNYSYNKASLLTSETYPSGRVVTNSFDTAGRLSTVASGGINYASAISYAAAGGVAQQTLGNGLIHNVEYNSRLQTTAIRLGTGADPNSVLSLVNDYGLWNGSSVVTSQNNGNLGRATITPGAGQTPFVETYTYDQLNRLATATENQSGVQQWKQSFTFDQWGNRSVDTINTTGNVMPPALTYNTATNRITGPGVYGFDNAGNMTQDPLSGTTTYTFNGDNRVATAVRNSVTVGTYTYDGEGRRVKRVTSTTTTRYIFDAGGKLVAEYTGSTPTLDREYIANAVAIAVSQAAPGGAVSGGLDTRGY